MSGCIYFVDFNPLSPLCIKIFSLSLSVRDRESERKLIASLWTEDMRYITELNHSKEVLVKCLHNKAILTETRAPVVRCFVAHSIRINASDFYTIMVEETSGI